MMPMRICAVAVDVSTYSIDKLYDYMLPPELADLAQIGSRVLVPFGRANKKTEAVILAFRSSHDPNVPLKCVEMLLDDEPALTERQIKLAIYMREHLYCRFFDCIRVILPAGFWFKRRELYALRSKPEHAMGKPYDDIVALFNEDFPEQSLEDLCRRGGAQFHERDLQKLCRDGVLKTRSEIKQKSNDLLERHYALAVGADEAYAQINPRRSPGQLDVVACLADGTAMPAKELMYMTGVRESTLRTMVKKGLLAVEEVEKYRLPDFSQVPEMELPVLNREQEQAFCGLAELLSSGQPQCALLYGVTGSGKTQVYLRLIHQALMDGKSAIILVPEIGLTSQFIRIFAGCFGEQVAILHSALSVGERYDSWKRIRSGEARVVLGTRSAVFSPAENLGLIIIDEEQDGAYRSEQTPRYHARDIARQRAVQENALLVLGSATPSVETFDLAQQKKIALFELRRRYRNALLPNVILADRREEIREGWDGSIGAVLHEELVRNRDRGEQSILFLNRRGDSRKMCCAVCGWVPECPYCSATMTYHSVNHRAICHLCGASIKIGETCPECGSMHIFTEQPGTQRLEQEIHQILPDARVLRMDADTTVTKNSHEKILESFGKQEADILLGTQMVTKGLDFERVTLVGVIDADQSLFAQDYRARERTFSMITQVVGRAGRSQRPGRAVIQTYNPEHPILLAAARQDYDSFYAEEIARREALLLPPVEDFVMLTATGELENVVLDSLIQLKWRIQSLMQGQFKDFHYPVLGPSPKSIVRVAGRYRYHLIIRCPDTPRRRALISGLLTEFAQGKYKKNVSLYVDNNPDSF